MCKPQEPWQICKWYFTHRTLTAENKAKNSFQTSKKENGKSYDFGQSINKNLAFIVCCFLCMSPGAIIEEYCRT